MNYHTLNLNIINNSDNPIPKHETDGSAGIDLRSNEEISLKSKEYRLISTGIIIELPKGFEAQIRSRSGLAYKHGVCVLNSPGTIDSDYRGEIKILLINHGNHTFEIKKGMRIAQMVISKHITCKLVEVENFNCPITERGINGFGSTGQE